jgi:hypothetical protein
MGILLHLVLTDRRASGKQQRLKALGKRRHIQDKAGFFSSASIAWGLPLRDPCFT